MKLAEEAVDTQRTGLEASVSAKAGEAAWMRDTLATDAERYAPSEFAEASEALLSASASRSDGHDHSALVDDLDRVQSAADMLQEVAELVSSGKRDDQARLEAHQRRRELWAKLRPSVARITGVLLGGIAFISVEYWLLYSDTSPLNDLFHWSTAAVKGGPDIGLGRYIIQGGSGLVMSIMIIFTAWWLPGLVAGLLVFRVTLALFRAREG